VNVTFDIALKQRIWQMINRSIADAADPHCPFCGTAMSAKNFAGAALIQGELRAFDSNIICLMGLAKEFKDYV
jgi:hypothetical protein